MNTYCNIYELEPDKINEYIKVHEACPDWQVKALKDAGAINLEIYIWDKYCIITYVCKDDFDKFIDNLSMSADNTRWQSIVNGMFAKTPVISGAELKPLKKIFSLSKI